MNNHSQAAMRFPELVQKTRASLADAYLLAFFLGLFGAHYFYLRRPRWGFLYLFTFGLLGVGWLIDLFRLKFLVSRFNEDTSEQNQDVAKKKRLDDAYVLWFPGGLLGLHHFYLNNRKLGFLYLGTFGIFGIGWIIDAFLMEDHVILANSDDTDDKNTEKRFTTTCILAISPTGLVGAHHYYLGRYYFGVLYTFTFGIFGVGYIVDWFRFNDLLERSNNDENKNHRQLDDAYLLWFPFGLVGLHHFYLKRPVWGLLYIFTLGFCGIGWMFDLYRMNELIENCNEEIDEELNRRNKMRASKVTYNSEQKIVAIPTITGKRTLQARSMDYPLPTVYSNQRLGIYQKQQKGYGFNHGMNYQPPPYEAASIPTKGH